MRLLLLAFFVLTSLTSAQVEGIWQNYTNMSDITSIDVNNQILWAGTSGGVFSYNYATSEYNTFTKSEGLSSQNITSIKIHPDGNIWVGTLEGYIDVINPEKKSISYITDIAKTNQSSKRINDFLIIGDSVYIATDFGISLINAGSRLFVETYTKLGNLTTNSKVFNLSYDFTIKALCEKGIAELIPGAVNPASPDAWNSIPVSGSASLFENSTSVSYGGKEYIGTNIGVYRNVGTTILPDFLSGEIIYDLKVIENIFYIITSDKIYSYDGSNTQLISSFTDYTLKGIYSGNESLLLTSNGVTNFPTTGTDMFISPGGPGSNSFSDMVVDDNGNFWAGSGRASLIGGIYKFDGTSWQNFNHQNTDVIKYDGFHQLYKGKDNTVYFANWGAGFSTYANDTFSSYYPPDLPVAGISVNPNFLVVWNLEEDSDGNLWLLNYEASDRNVLSVKSENDEWTHFRMASPLTAVVPNAEHFAIDQNDTKWFGVSSTNGKGPGLYYFNENGTLDDLDDDIWGVVKATDGLSNNYITDITIDNRGEIWVGTTEGITVIIDPVNPTSRMQSVFPLRTQSITCIAVDPVNRKWVGTTQGVFVVSSDGTDLIANYTVDNSPIPTNIIKTITIDENSGRSYIGTDFGLSTLTTMSIKPVDSAGDLEIFPSPFIVGEHDNIYIDKLVKESSIKILSIDGRLIRELETPGGRLGKWDGKDQNGNFVSSGVYVVVAYDTEANDVQLGKIAVIRK